MGLAGTIRQIKAAKVYTGKGVGAHLTQSHSECTNRTLLHDASSQLISRNWDSRCIPYVEGMLALVKQGVRSVNCSTSG